MFAGVHDAEMPICNNKMLVWSKFEQEPRYTDISLALTHHANPEPLLVSFVQ
jgi:hypothetical protein